MADKAADAESGSAAQRWRERWPVEPGRMAPYLARRCPIRLRDGRRFKTMLRFAAWRPDLGESRSKCLRCGNGLNSVQHVLLHFVRRSIAKNGTILFPVWKNGSHRLAIYRMRRKWIRSWPLIPHELLGIIPYICIFDVSMTPQTV